MTQAQPRYALSHESYQKDICRGLSSLQQNGEYVDMTVAADGHVVRVHKIVMSLGSPYFKEIIDSAEGQQPMIYLNKVSYSILSSILEYVYSGQTHVEAYDLDEFMQVAKDLHISGLTELDLADKEFNKVDTIKYQHEQEVAKMIQRQNLQKANTSQTPTVSATPTISANQTKYIIKSHNDTMGTTEEYYEVTEHDDTSEIIVQPKKEITSADNKALYTVSNQGTIQMIFNRYVYALNYLYLKKPGYRKWRCVEAKEHKCPAIIVTQEDRVVKRQRAHTHPFHDRRILKRMKDRAVFTAISDLKKAFGDQAEVAAVGSDIE